jgi:hypothetical protein
MSRSGQAELMEEVEMTASTEKLEVNAGLQVKVEVPEAGKKMKRWRWRRSWRRCRRDHGARPPASRYLQYSFPFHVADTPNVPLAS